MVNLNKLNKNEFGKLLTPERIYKFKYKEEVEKLYQKIYFDNMDYRKVANFYALSVILTIIAYIFSYGYIQRTLNDYMYDFIYKFLIIYLSFFIMNIVIFYLVLFMYYFYHDSRFKKREEDIEKDLPEFIDNLVSNLKGGISLEKALMKSVRAEQRSLLSEVTLINQKIMMGDNVYAALRNFRLRFESQIINRTFFLIEEGIKSGGNVAKPLERISNNLKKIYNLNDEVKASSSGFSMVIRAITLIIAPLLFALAMTLLTFIGNLFVIILKSGNDMIPVNNLPEEFVSYLSIFSYAMIILITFFSSLITAELKNEKIHNSMKYLPIYIILGMFMYYIFDLLLSSMFSGFL